MRKTKREGERAEPIMKGMVLIPPLQDRWACCLSTEEASICSSLQQLSVAL